MAISLRSAPPIRAVFIDIDGTLINHQSDAISPAVLASLRAARQAGCEIVLCTGRARFTAMPIVTQLDRPHSYLVCSNGGLVMHLETREVIHRMVLSREMAVTIARALVDLGAAPYIYEDSVGEGIEASRVLHHPDLPVGPWATRPRYQAHAAILTDLPFDPISVCCFGPPEQIRPLVPQLRERLPACLSLIESGTELAWGIEVFREGVGKGSGAAQVAARLNLEREQVMAIGDHANDIDMLEWAGIGVAMGNALPEVRAVADWVTDSHAEDGVARAIERFVLESVSPGSML
jgi:Cof subfamily protein (haloacid dehalogenase superfamily)